MEAVIYTLDNLADLSQNATPQDNSKSCYAEKLAKSEALIDWAGAAHQIDRQVRAGIGRSPAFTLLNGQRLRIFNTVVLEHSTAVAPGTITSVEKDSFTVACLDSTIRVDRVQIPGKKPMSVAEVLNSRPAMFRAGLQFTAIDLQQE